MRTILTSEPPPNLTVQINHIPKTAFVLAIDNIYKKIFWLSYEQDGYIFRWVDSGDGHSGHWPTIKEAIMNCSRFEYHTFLEFSNLGEAIEYINKEKI